MKRLPILALPLLVGAFAVVVPAASQAQAGQVQAGAPPSPTFLLIPEFVLEVDGQPAPDALVYHSPGRGTILVRSEKLPVAAVELAPRGRGVFTFDEEALIVNADSSVEIKNVATPTPAGNFQLVENLPVFEVAGTKARFLNKPPLLGEYDGARLKKEIPAYAARAARYEPQQIYLQPLKAQQRDIRIRVFFGSWCSVCSKLLPNILRVADELEGSAISFEYYGLPQGAPDPEAQRLNVGNLPYGILYSDGEEIGRVSGHSWNFPAMSIFNTVKP